MCVYIQKAVFLAQTPNRVLLLSKSQKEIKRAVNTDSWLHTPELNALICIKPPDRGCDRDWKLHSHYD